MAHFFNKLDVCAVIKRSEDSFLGLIRVSALFKSLDLSQKLSML